MCGFQQMGAGPSSPQGPSNSAPCYGAAGLRVTVGAKGRGRADPLDKPAPYKSRGAGVPALSSRPAWQTLFSRFLSFPPARLPDAGHPVWAPPARAHPWAVAMGHVSALPSFPQCLSASLLLVSSREALILSWRGCYPSSLGVPFTTRTITGLLLRRPPAHQTSSLSQRPDRHSPALSFAKTPCEPLPIS